ncbi:MAG: right-handed parallel beta-helix repeat-containing protein [Thermodesulfobacteriota bacterium]
MKKHSIGPKDFLSKAIRLDIRKMTALLILILCFGISSSWGAKPALKIYVNASAALNGDGTSWATAFTDLQDALEAAVSGDEIWVAAGTYTPTDSSDRSVSFVLKSGVALYGGFAGGEKALRERSLDPGLTVLSGDIGTPDVDTDNSYHVVYAAGVTGAVLDGFTVTRGRGGDNSAGAGMYNTNSALTVANCIFSNNKVAVGTVWGWATGRGGGMYNKNSAPIVTNCTFIANQAGNTVNDKIGAGGGMYNEGYFDNGVDRQSPVISGCTFSDNVASSKWEVSVMLGGGGGGGMYNFDCSPTIDRCTFVRNLGGMGGGMLNFYAQPTITNCIFNTNSNNYGDGKGGAIYNLADATILNCTFYQNGWRLFPVGYPEPRFRAYTAAGGAV